MSFENTHDDTGTLQEKIAAWRTAHYSEISVTSNVTEPIIATLDDIFEDPLWHQQVAYRPEFVETTCAATTIEVFGNHMRSFLQTDISLRHVRYWNEYDSFNESYLLHIGVTDNRAHNLPAYRTWLAIRRYRCYDSFSLLSSLALRWAVWGSGGQTKADDAVEWDSVVQYDLDQIASDLDAFGHTLRSNARHLYPGLYGRGE